MKKMTPRALAAMMYEETAREYRNWRWRTSNTKVTIYGFKEETEGIKHQWIILARWVLKNCTFKRRKQRPGSRT